MRMIRFLTTNAATESATKSRQASRHSLTHLSVSGPCIYSSCESILQTEKKLAL